MIKNVICDYIRGFSLSRVRQAYQHGGYFFIAYAMTAMPLVCGFFEDAESVITYYMVMFPALFCLYAAPLHPFIMPKVMYLCPMDRQERHRYIEWSGYLHIIVPFILGVAGVLILLILNLTDVVCACGLLLNMLILPIWCCGMNSNGFGEISENGKRHFNINTGTGIRETVGIFVTILSEFAYCCILRWHEHVPLLVKCVWLGVGVFFQLPLTIRYLKGWNEAVERAASYETAYK